MAVQREFVKLCAICVTRSPQKESIDNGFGGNTLPYFFAVSTDAYLDIPDRVSLSVDVEAVALFIQAMCCQGRPTGIGYTHQYSLFPDSHYLLNNIY